MIWLIGYLIIGVLVALVINVHWNWWHPGKIQKTLIWPIVLVAFVIIMFWLGNQGLLTFHTRKRTYHQKRR